MEAVPGQAPPDELLELLDRELLDDELPEELLEELDRLDEELLELDDALLDELLDELEELLLDEEEEPAELDELALEDEEALLLLDELLVEDELALLAPEPDDPLPPPGTGSGRVSDSEQPARPAARTAAGAPEIRSRNSRLRRRSAESGGVGGAWIGSSFVMVPLPRIWRLLDRSQTEPRKP